VKLWMETPLSWKSFRATSRNLLLKEDASPVRLLQHESRPYPRSLRRQLKLLVEPFGNAAACRFRGAVTMIYVPVALNVPYAIVDRPHRRRQAKSAVNRTGSQIRLGQAEPVPKPRSVQLCSRRGHLVDC